MSKIFVGGFSSKIDNESLKEHFDQYGTITDAIVIDDRETGRSRGFGFVTFSSPEEARTATDAANGTEFEGRKITVDIATERTERAQRT